MQWGSSIALNQDRTAHVSQVEVSSGLSSGDALFLGDIEAPTTVHGPSVSLTANSIVHDRATAQACISCGKLGNGW